MDLSRKSTPRIYVSMCFVFMLSACGGGGGGGGRGGGSSNPAAPVFHGNLEFAVISAENAPEIVSNVFGDAQSLTQNIGVSAINTGPKNQAVSSVPIGLNRLSTWLRKQSESIFAYNKSPLALDDAEGSSPTRNPLSSAVSINEAEPCESGFVRIQGTLTNEGKGMLDVIYDNCLVDGDVLNGSGSLSVTEVDPDRELITDSVLILDVLVVKGVSGDFRLAGTFSSSNPYGPRETDIINVVVENNVSGYQVKTSYLEIERIATPSYYSEKMTGRVYSDSTGFVDIETKQAFFYVDPSYLYAPIPDDLGSIILTGKNGATIEVKVVTPERLQVNIDADIDGQYEFRNTVPRDATSTSPASPVPEIQSEYSGEVIATPVLVALDAGNSFDANGELLTYRWDITSEPESGAGVLSSTSLPQAEFRANVGGVYYVQLTVSDGLSSEVSTMRIEALDAVPGPAKLAFQVIDAEYSKALNSIVMVSTKPNTLHLYDPVTHQDDAIELPLKPNNVSISADGKFAVVGHDGYITYVDLVQKKSIQSFEVSIDVFDIILDGNGYIYALSAKGPADRFRTISVATGIEVLSGWNYSSRTRARLHPNGESVYMIQSEASGGAPPNKYTVTEGNITYDHGLPATSSYSDGCGNLWLSEDGEKIVSACGDVFNASAIQAQDLTYNGSLPLSENIKQLASSSQQRQLAAITMTDTAIKLFDDQTLVEIRHINLPKYITNKEIYTRHGEFVFYNSDGSEIYVLTQLGGQPNFDDSYDLLTYKATNGELVDSGYSSNNSTPIAKIEMDQVLEIGEPVILTGSNSSDRDRDLLSYSWTFDSKPEGSISTISDATSAVAEFIPDVRGTYAVKFSVFDGQATDTDTLLIQVSSAVALLDYRVIDAEYSSALDRIIMVSKDPDALHIYDPEAGQEKTILLAHIPINVSVSPDGKFAVVGHLRNVSYIDLQNEQLKNTFPVSYNNSGVMLAGNGLIYAFGGDFDQVRSIDVSTGAETFFAGARDTRTGDAKLHHDGVSVYVASSPWTMDKYSIATGNIEYLHSTSQPGVTDNCYGHWVSNAGDKLFTGCGTIFTTSTDPNKDLLYNGSLPMSPSISSMDFSVETNRVITVSDYKEYIQVYDGSFFNHQQQFYTPNMTVPGGTFRSYGDFVFFNKDGSRFYIILGIVRSSGTTLTDYHGVAAYGSD